MPQRFEEVVPNLLFRGGAPKPWEVAVLKNIFKIEQIISLDKQSALKIDKECKDNGIQHIIIPIHMENFDEGINVISNGVSRLVDNKKTYVHCLHGKDRTGLFIAKYRIENGWDCKKAMDEAISFGFGIGVDDDIIERYVNVIIEGCKIDLEHVTPKQVLKEIKKKIVCKSCGSIKGKYCNNCIITSSIMKNAKIMFEEDLPEGLTSATEESAKQTFDSENPIEGIDVPQQSHMFSVMGSKQRVALLKRMASVLSFKLPRQEKEAIAKCVQQLQELIEDTLLVTTKTKIVNGKQIKEKIDILDIMYNSFSANKGITPEQAKKAEVHFKTFAEVIRNNSINVKKKAAVILDLLDPFDSDADIAAMTVALFDSIDKIDSQEALLIDILIEDKDKDFQENVIKLIDEIKQLAAQMKQLVKERMIPFFRKEVLGENWATEIRKEIENDKSDRKEQTGQK